MTKLILKDECYRVIGACFEVYKEKGCGFLEGVYQECLEIELEARGIPFEAQRPLELRYKGRLLTQKYVPDFICYDSMILEIKAVKTVGDDHRAQVQNYLRATGRPLGLLVNFGFHSKLQWERIVFTNEF